MLKRELAANYAQIILHSGCTHPIHEEDGEWISRKHTWIECEIKYFYIRIAKKQLTKMASAGWYFKGKEE